MAIARDQEPAGSGVVCWIVLCGKLKTPRMGLLMVMGVGLMQWDVKITVTTGCPALGTSGGFTLEM